MGPTEAAIKVCRAPPTTWPGGMTARCRAKSVTLEDQTCLACGKMPGNSNLTFSLQPTRKVSSPKKIGQQNGPKTAPHQILSTLTFFFWGLASSSQAHRTSKALTPTSMGHTGHWKGQGVLFVASLSEDRTRVLFFFSPPIFKGCMCKWKKGVDVETHAI